MHDGIHVRRREADVDGVRNRADEPFHAAREDRADAVERHDEDERHDGEENRDGRVLARQIPIHLRAALVLLALVRPHDRLLAEIREKREAHVRERCLGVEAALLFHDAGNLVVDGLLVRRNAELRLDERIVLDELRRRKTQRQPRFFRERLDEMRHGMDAAMHGGHGVVGVVAVDAEIDARRPLMVARDVQRMVDELLDALVFRRRNRDDRDAERRLELIDVDVAAVRPHLVHHVQREHHRDAELHDLHREIEIALEVRRVDDVDDAVRMRVQEEIARDDLLIRIRRQRVHAREIRHARVRVQLHLPVLAVDRHAREIADVLVRARQLVEERRLAAVLVADERERNRRILGNLRRTVVMVIAWRAVKLADARMRDGKMIVRLRHVRRFFVVQPFHLQQPRFLEAQRQLIPAHFHLDGIAHRRALHDLDVRARRQAHVEQVMTERARPLHDTDERRLARLQFI